MDNLQILLTELEEQEQVLQFTNFNNDTAWEIGKLLADKARERNYPVTIDITRNGQQLFHCAMEGTSPDNDQWILRKNRVVNRFHISSYRMGIKLRIAGKSMEDAYFISSQEYAAHGGAFPIRIKGSGVVGTITVSGLPQKDDHGLLTEVLKEYLGV